MKKTYLNPTIIEWCDYTWNPIVGCKRNCRYCYGKTLNKRFKRVKNWEEPELFEERLPGPSIKKKGTIIFVCSMSDLMAPWTPKEWIERIIKVMEENPRHTFMLLTKDPKRYHEFTFPPNVYLGVTLDDAKYEDRIDNLIAYNKSKVLKYVSVEPILSSMEGVNFSGIDKIVIGAETGQGAKKPDIEWVLSVDHSDIYLKDSLFRHFPELKGKFKSAKNFHDTSLIQREPIHKYPVAINNDESVDYKTGTILSPDDKNNFVAEFSLIDLMMFVNSGFNVKPKHSRNPVTQNYHYFIVTAAKRYSEIGLKIVPLKKMDGTEKGKRPYQTNWINREFSASDIAVGDGIGLKTGIQLQDGTYFHAIDIDSIEHTEEIFKATLKIFSIPTDKAVFQLTASGGCHILFKTSEPLRERVLSIGKNEQIELKGIGRQIVISPTRAQGRDRRVKEYKLFGDIRNLPFIDVSALKKYFGYEPEGTAPKSSISETHRTESVLHETHPDNASMESDQVLKNGENQNHFTYVTQTKELMSKSDLNSILDHFDISHNDHPDYVNLICPFHDENDPSFVIYKNSYVCTDYHTYEQYSLIDFLLKLDPSNKDMIETSYEIRLDARIPFHSQSLEKNFSIQAQEYEYTKFISEQSQLIERIISDDKNYEIIAPTGSGKTESIILTAKNKSVKLVCLFPLRSTTHQKAEKYELQGVDSSVDVNDIMLNSASNTVILGTYDSIKKFLNSGLDLSLYVIVLDEYHNFYTQADFRNGPLRMVEENLSKFRKVIKMTGTPEGIFIANREYEKIRFKPKNHIPIAKEYLIIPYQSDVIKTVRSFIIKRQHKGRVVILMNNINMLNRLKNIIIDSGIEPEEIAVIHAKKSLCDDMVSIKEYEVIKPNTRFLLTTTVISDGVNILDEDIEAVYLIDVKDVLVLRQFVARFRKGIQTCFDFIPGKNKDYQKLPDFYERLNRCTIETEKAVRNSNDKLPDRKSADRKVNISKNLLSDMQKNVYYSQDLGIYEVNHNYLRYKILEEFNSIFLNSPLNRKEYLSVYGNLDVKIDDTVSEASDIGDTLMTDVLMDQNEGKLQKLLLRSGNEVVQTYQRKVKTHYGTEIMKKYPVPSEFIVNNFYADQVDLFEDGNVCKIIERYITCRENKIPHGMAVEFCMMNTRDFNYFITDMNIIVIRDILMKYPEIDQLQIINSTLDKLVLIKAIIDYVSEQDGPINTNEMYISLVEFLKANGIPLGITQRQVARLFLNMFVVKRLPDKDPETGKTIGNPYQILGNKSLKNLFNEYKEKNDQICFDFETNELYDALYGNIYFKIQHHIKDDDIADDEITEREVVMS